MAGKLSCVIRGNARPRYSRCRLDRFHCTGKQTRASTLASGDLSTLSHGRWNFWSGSSRPHAADVLHNFFYAGFSYLGGLLADRFPKNLLLIGGYTLAGVRCLGVVFLPASIGSLAIVFMLGGVQVAFEKTLEDPFCAELVEPAQHGMAFGVLATAGRLGRSVLIGRS